MIPVKPDARRIILLEATIVTYLLILQDQRVEWEQQQRGRTHFIVVRLYVCCVGRNPCVIPETLENINLTSYLC